MSMLRCVVPRRVRSWRISLAKSRALISRPEPLRQKHRAKSIRRWYRAYLGITGFRGALSKYEWVAQLSLLRPGGPRRGTQSWFSDVLTGLSELDCNLNRTQCNEGELGTKTRGHSYQVGERLSF